MRNKKIALYLLLGLSLTACKKNSQNQDIEMGEIKNIDTTQKEENNKDTLSIENTRLKDLYTNDENRELYMPDNYVYTDEKNNIRYERKNIPEYGISALIPKGFELITDPNLSKANFSSMVSLYGNTEQTKGIQISFYARPEDHKNKNVIKQSFYDDIMANYSYVNRGDIYKLISLKGGELEEFYSDKDIYISTKDDNYIEMIHPVEGLDNTAGEKLLRWTDKPEEFRLLAKDGAITKSIPAYINYGIVFDQGVITMVTFNPDKLELASDINKIVAESIAYMDSEQNSLLFSSKKREDKINDNRKLVMSDNMKKVSSSSYSSLYISDSGNNDTSIMKPTYMFAFYQKVQPHNPEILKYFKGLTQFKIEFASRFSNRQIDASTEEVAITETDHYYRNGSSVSTGYYGAVVNGTKEEGIYYAIYIEDTGEIYVLMMNSDRFTEDIKRKELSRIIDRIR